MTEQHSDHWLWRLDAQGWLAAARVELEQGRTQSGSRRTAVTHARRAAGMALNAALVEMAARGWAPEVCEQVWGRSYIDHLRALAGADTHEPFDREQARRCRELLAIPVMPPTGLVKLARSRDEAAIGALDIAEEIVRECAAIVGLLSSAQRH
jgi:HEPN domain-containing protein